MSFWSVRGAEALGFSKNPVLHYATVARVIYSTSVALTVRTMKRTPPDRLATAYHEAGHAVIAYELGIPLQSVTIVPSEDAHGVVRHQDPLRGVRLDIDGSDRARLRTERAIMICFAGPLAQQRHRANSWRGYHGQSDFDLAADLAIRICGSGEEATAFLKWLQLKTKHKVRRSWLKIDQLAQVLLKQGTVTGRKVRTVLRPTFDSSDISIEKDPAGVQRITLNRRS
jgi:hypothetical protein